MGCPNAQANAEKLARIFQDLAFEVPKAAPEQYEELKTSVNPVRLKNHPVALDMDTVDALYHQILR